MPWNKKSPMNRPYASTIVEYCTPIFNRIGDLEYSLLKNFKFLRKRNNAKLTINAFDSESYRWAAEFIQKHQAQDVLRVFRMRKLKSWNFNIAKNSFKNNLVGTYYASLDGDNLIVPSQHDAIVDQIALNPNSIIHLWQGTWGDGTCGKIVVPSVVFKKVGYDEELFPRQFDEVSLLLRAMIMFPDLKLIHAPKANVFVESGKSAVFCSMIDLDESRFLEEEKFTCNRTLLPINRKHTNYENADHILSLYGQNNRNFTFIKCHQIGRGRQNLETNSRTSFVNALNEHWDSFLNQASEEQIDQVFNETFATSLVNFKTLDTIRFGVGRLNISQIVELASDDSNRDPTDKKLIVISDRLRFKDIKESKNSNVILLKPVVGRLETHKMLWVNLAIIYFKNSISHARTGLDYPHPFIQERKVV